MTKNELIDAVARSSNLSKRAAAVAVDATFETISKAIKKSKRFQIPGFGTFTVHSRKARQGRNSRTGAAITIKPSRMIGFKPASALQKNNHENDVLRGLASHYLP